MLKGFTKKNCNKQSLELKKVIKRKGNKLHVNWKGYEYFPKPKSFGGRKKVELDLSNYAKKADLKNETGADTSKFGKKVDLVSLKSDEGK